LLEVETAGFKGNRFYDIYRLFHCSRDIALFLS